MSETITQNYNETLGKIKERIHTAQNKSLNFVKAEMHEANFLEGTMFEFLDFDAEYKKPFLLKIKEFLKEMNHNLVFIERNYRLPVSDKEYIIDLLFYHRVLKSLVAVDLKIGEFLPEYVGKMQFYLAVLNDKVKLADENPSIGIILCKDKDKVIVEYALNQSTSPVGIAKYELVSKLPENLRGQLPTNEQIDKLLEAV